MDAYCYGRCQRIFFSFSCWNKAFSDGRIEFIFVTFCLLFVVMAAVNGFSANYSDVYGTCCYAGFLISKDERMKLVRIKAIIINVIKCLWLLPSERREKKKILFQREKFNLSFQSSYVSVCSMVFQNGAWRLN